MRHKFFFWWIFCKGRTYTEICVYCDFNRTMFCDTFLRGARPTTTSFVVKDGEGPVGNFTKGLRRVYLSGKFVFSPTPRPEVGVTSKTEKSANITGSDRGSPARNWWASQKLFLTKQLWWLDWLLSRVFVWSKGRVSFAGFAFHQKETGWDHRL